MTVYNKYIVSLIVASGLINAFLASFGQNSLEIYFVINIIAYLAITLFYAYINPRARRILNAIGIVLFSGCLIIVSLNVVRLVAGR